MKHTHIHTRRHTPPFSQSAYTNTNDLTVSFAKIQIWKIRDKISKRSFEKNCFWIFACKVRSSNTHLSKSSLKFTSSSCAVDCAGVCQYVAVCGWVGGWVGGCVCVCARARVSARMRALAQCCFDCVLVLCFVVGYVLQFGELAHKCVHYHYYYYYYYTF